MPGGKAPRVKHQTKMRQTLFISRFRMILYSSPGATRDNCQSTKFCIVTEVFYGSWFAGSGKDFKMVSTIHGYYSYLGQGRGTICTTSIPGKYKIWLP